MNSNESSSINFGNLKTFNQKSTTLLKSIDKQAFVNYWNDFHSGANYDLKVLKDQLKQITEIKGGETDLLSRFKQINSQGNTKKITNLRTLENINVTLGTLLTSVLYKEIVLQE